jgi:thiopurine S-methyltransferase
VPRSRDRGRGDPADAGFWHRRWQANEIGFHSHEINPLLVEHFAELAVPPHGRVCVPLCGKTLDIGWLLSQGCRVAGIELSEIAVRQLFEEMDIEPYIEEAGGFKLFRAPSVDIFCGDIFSVDRSALGPVDAVFDRAALTALPPKLRDRYAPHLVEITGAAPQLLITYLYDQRQMDGPPFSTSEADLRELYGSTYRIALLEEGELDRGLRSASEVVEQVWLLN